MHGGTVILLVFSVPESANNKYYKEFENKIKIRYLILSLVMQMLLIQPLFQVSSFVFGKQLPNSSGFRNCVWGYDDIFWFFIGILGVPLHIAVMWLIAQEVEFIIPEVVHTDSETTMKLL